MDSFTRVPVTAAVFAGMAFLLSGCIAYDAASAAVDAGATVVSTASDVVTSPFGSGESEKIKSN